MADDVVEEAPAEDAAPEETAVFDTEGALTAVETLLALAEAAPDDPTASAMLPVLQEWKTALGSGESDEAPDEEAPVTEEPMDFSAASVFSTWKADLNERRAALGLDPVA